MKIFTVTLTKSYNITIQAKNEKEAKKLSEFYIGDGQDLSTLEEREKENFQIEKINCTLNEAFDAKLIGEE